MIIYYTDWHDVDEDMTTIPYYGGDWTNTNAGIAHRHPFADPNSAGVVFASSTVEIFDIIRMGIMSTKTL